METRSGFNSSEEKVLTPPDRLSRRALQTRRHLIESARIVFENRGYLDARVADVVDVAGLSQGTFYNYFLSKDDVFRAVAELAISEMIANLNAPETKEEDQSRVVRAVKKFVSSYKPQARILGLLEQVGTFSPEMRSLRLELRNRFLELTLRGIERNPPPAVTGGHVNAEALAESLGAMLEYSCYVWLVLEKETNEEELVASLSYVWSQSLAAPMSWQTGAGRAKKSRLSVDSTDR